MFKRLMWAGLITVLGSAASIVVDRAAAMIWRRTFGEEPPA